MPDGAGPVTARVVDRLDEVPAAAWDACAGADNPFVSHAFLQALEASGSVSAQSGWLPHHLLLEDGDGRLLGAVPMYLKGHSYGEYVFDHGWANALEQAGGSYYPKLQVAAPFTPVTGPRLLAAPERAAGRTDDVRALLVQALEKVAARLGVSSVHVTFPTEAEWALLGAAGWVQRTGQQYHWYNHGYATFDDFLGALVSRKRKAIRKERRAVAEQGITVRALGGPGRGRGGEGGAGGGAIEPRHWDAFHRFYVSTYDRKWGYPYLTREFFEIIDATMPDQVVLVLAEHDGVPVAGALNLRGTDALFGRNWGCAGDYKFLHFEACYYQAIDYAIAHGLARVEAGTQGPHKLQRGYVPVPTYSAHWIANKSFREAVARFCASETAMVAEELLDQAEYSPYRRET